MNIPILLVQTVLLRPYVFIFLIVFLVAANRLLGSKRTIFFFLITWVTAFLCEFSSTRTGFPFGWYFYTGATVGQELYLANVPFMDSLSFTFLLFASYCLTLLFLAPQEDSNESGNKRRLPRLVFDIRHRTSWPVIGLTALFFAFIDIVIDPVALRGDRWFLGQIYGYPEAGTYFGVPLANFVGWAIVGLIAMGVYRGVDRRLSSAHSTLSEATQLERRQGSYIVTWNILFGCGLYYGVLIFNLAVTFWIGEALLGMVGVLIYLPITVLACLRLGGRLPESLPKLPGDPLAKS